MSGVHVASVLGIDVSTRKVAVAHLRGPETCPIRVSWWEVEAQGRRAADRFRALIEGFAAELRNRYPPDGMDPERVRPAVAFVEDIGFSKGRRAELDLARVQGAVMAHLYDVGFVVIRINPLTWRGGLSLASNSKDEIRRWVNTVFKVEVPSEDVADAVCVALHGMRAASPDDVFLPFVTKQPEDR